MDPNRKLKLPHVESWHFILCSVLVLALQQYHGAENPEPIVEGQPQHAWVALIQLVIVVALSLLASYLIAKGRDNPLKDDKPTTLVTRGSFVTWVLGIRRVGPLFCWAGDRGFHEESGGKKGVGDGPKTKIWNEGGWHLLAVGPGFCLHRILDNGEAVFEGPITRAGHPSGTFIDLGSQGGFFIYWGEADQPINTYLGDPDRVGISSRWPYHFYVLWANKRLGASANWSLLDYEIEVRIESSNLVQSDPHLLSTQGSSINTTSLLAVSTGGPTDFWEFDLPLAHFYPSKSLVDIAGNAISDQTLEVLFSELFVVVLEPRTLFHDTKRATRTRVHFAAGALTGADAAGTLTAFDFARNFGVNAAHAIDAMLHTPWPKGLGIPTSGILAGFSIPSLEDLGVLLGPAGEGLRTSWISVQGDSVATVLGTGLQDLGVMIPIDPATGLIIFRAMRDPTGTTISRIRTDLIVGPLPEVEILHANRPADRMTFSFPDRTLTDRDGTIAIMDDGQILQGLELQHARNVQITITTDFDTASQIAQRRSAEELAGGSAVTLRTNRATRNLMPGDVIVVDALPELMRVTSVKLDTETNSVALELMADFYGVPITPFLDSAPPATAQIKAVEGDILSTIIEVSEYFLGTAKPTVIVPRIRAHNQIFQARLSLSRDNITYTEMGVESNLQTGGSLDAILPGPNTEGAGSSEGGLLLLEQGPEFTALGPDIGIVADLSADQTNWRLGRQLCIIASLAGREICFLRNITALGGSTWRLDGLLRGQLETRAITHEAGADIYILDRNKILQMQDPLIAIGLDLFAKAQPTAGGTLPIDAVTENDIIVRGRGQSFRPVPAGALAVTSPWLINAYQTGDDLDFRWDFGTPQQQTFAAGMQPAGTALAGVPPLPDEDFQIEIRNAAGTVVQRTEFQILNTFTITNAEIITDHGSELTFQLWVYQRRGGLLSEPVIIMVEKL